ncbi:MAG: hypothetical protein LBU67_00905 [Oscillospiraceae bacterium]|jgi:hypothetical protein|nr:hypothetical protein [Oscillospiraceae bacterium]
MIACLLFALLCAPAFALAALAKRRFEQALPVTMLGLMLWLYAWGLAGSVRLGVYTAWGMAALAAAYSAFAARRGRVRWHRQWLTPGFAVFALLFFGFWLAQAGRRPIAWDDFSHWALAVKNMWFTGGFGNGPQATTLFRDYPPALALLAYFFVRTGSVWREDMLYRAHAVLLCALSMPLFAGVDWRRGWRAALLLPVAVLLPQVFFAEAYLSLYADAALGMLLAFLLTQASQTRDGFGRAASGLAAAVLALTKQSGLGLAVIGWGCALAAALPSSMKHARARGIRVRGRELARAALPLLAALFAWTSWKLVCLKVGASASWGAGEDLPGALLALVTRRGPAYRYDVIVYFFRALLSPRGGLRLPATALLVCIGALYACWLRLLPKAARRSLTREGAALLLGGLAYATGLLCAYLFAFVPGEAVALASMDRYLGTYLLGTLGFVAHGLLGAAQALPQKRRFATALLLCLALLLPLTDWQALVKATVQPQVNVAFSRQALAPLEEARQQAEVTPEARVWFFAPESAGYEYFQAKYVFTPIAIGPENGWRSLPQPAPGQTHAQALAYALQAGGYTHIYLQGPRPDDFETLYGELFPGGAPKPIPDGLYPMTIAR